MDGDLISGAEDARRLGQLSQPLAELAVAVLERAQGEFGVDAAVVIDLAAAAALDGPREARDPAAAVAAAPADVGEVPDAAVEQVFGREFRRCARCRP